MNFTRSAGILLPIFSLPEKYGIGTFGHAAYDFVDFLKRAKQSYWQILPLNPTMEGNSPYSSYSTFAGNPLLIDLQLLVEDGLLDKKDLKNIKVKNEEIVDYNYLNDVKNKLLLKAYKEGFKKVEKEFKKFEEENSSWLIDYALFVALKNKFKTEWQNWDDNIKKRKVSTLKKYKQELSDDIKYYEFVQYLFYKQYLDLRKYANDNGIKIIGDLPFYVTLDSSDCWSNPKEFKLDDQYIPSEVAGVPPDYFSEDGQLWGNPLYNWDNMKSNGYKWWIERIGLMSKLYDVIRIDHFRAFEAYWSIPYGAKTAKEGKWIKGPNMEFLNVIKGWFYNVDFIAEDLGIHTDGLQQMLNEFAFPGMKVLQFGFNAKEYSDHAPHAIKQNCICYVGTHDNDTIMGWYDNGDKDDVSLAEKYIGCNNKDNFNWDMIRAGMSTIANVFICQIQDYLGLGSEYRINTPGTVENNWKYRVKKEQLTMELADKIAEYTIRYQRG